MIARSLNNLDLNLPFVLHALGSKLNVTKASKRLGLRQTIRCRLVWLQVAILDVAIGPIAAARGLRIGQLLYTKHFIRIVHVASQL